MKWYLASGLLLLVSCSPQREAQPFDARQWQQSDGSSYPARAAMLSDLMRQEIHGISKDSLIRLLGAPDRTNEGYLYYKISEEKIGFLPVQVKTLVIKLKADSTVAWRKIHG